jgi:hypothetical protein
MDWKQRALAFIEAEGSQGSGNEDDDSAETATEAAQTTEADENKSGGEFTRQPKTHSPSTSNNVDVDAAPGVGGYSGVVGDSGGVGGSGDGGREGSATDNTAADANDDNDDEDQVTGRWGPLGQVKEFSCPAWNEEWNAYGPRDFMVSLAAYRKFRVALSEGSKVPAETQAISPPKELVEAGKKQLKIARAKAEKDEARRTAARKRDAEKETRLTQLHEEKLRKIAEKEQAKREKDDARERERLEKLREREEAKAASDEIRRLKQIELEQKKQERAAEKEKKRQEREIERLKQKTTRQARGSTPDEELDTFHIDPPTGAQWDAEGPQLPAGDLLSVWNFLCMHAESIACPVLSLKTLRGALSVPARAAELTDIHVALMRVLLLNMDTIPDPATGKIAEPPRAHLLTAQTWPYMACMFLEENADRLKAKENQLSGMLWEKEYHKIDPEWKLELLNVLCNECMACELIRNNLDDTRSYTSGKDTLGIKKKAVTHDSLADGEGGLDDEAGGPKQRCVRLLGTDRRRNRYYALGDEEGQPFMIAVHRFDSALYEKKFRVSNAAHMSVVEADPPPKDEGHGSPNAMASGQTTQQEIGSQKTTGGGLQASTVIGGDGAEKKMPIKEESIEKAATMQTDTAAVVDTCVLSSGNEIPAPGAAYAHGEIPPESSRNEVWNVFCSAADIKPVVEYLDMRGTRESVLKVKMQEVVNAMESLEDNAALAEYADYEADDVEDVLSALISGLEAAAKQREERLASVGIVGKITLAALKRQAPNASEWSSASRLVASADDAAEGMEEEEEDRDELREHIIADDLDGHAVWAKMGNTGWWPASVVPLCADIPPNVKRQGKQKERHRRKGRSEEDYPENLVLVQFADSNDYGWVERTDVASFWENYEQFSKLDRSKKFTNALRQGRMRRYGEHSLKCASAAALFRRKAARLCDLMEMMDESFAWQHCKDLDSALDKREWHDRLEKIVQAAASESKAMKTIEAVPLVVLQLLNRLQEIAVLTNPYMVHDWWHKCATTFCRSACYCAMIASLTFAPLR